MIRPSHSICSRRNSTGVRASVVSPLSLSTMKAAQVGSVASAVRYLAKQVMMGGSGDITRTSIPEMKGNLISEKGLGRDLIISFLGGVPAENTVKQYLAILKSSGDYARII